MTTPRIEEMVEEFRQKFGLYELRYVEHGKESVERIMGTAIIQKWLRTTLTQAHEEGAKAERAKVVEWAKKHVWRVSYPSGERADTERAKYYNQALDDLIAHLSNK